MNSHNFVNRTDLSSGLRIIGLVILAVSWLGSTVWAQSYSGGSGTSSDPYQIATKADLVYLSTYSSEWGYHYVQTADILFSSSDFESGGIAYNDGKGFYAIGTPGTPFTGTYEGAGYVIDSLKSNNPPYSPASTFGGLGSGGTIANLGVTNVNYVDDGQYVGGLVGYMVGGTITNCYTTGSVTSSATVVGGLVGAAWGGSITLSWTSCSSTGAYWVGGFAGWIDDPATISNSYATGSVTGDPGTGNFIGGFTGYESGGIVANCYSIGAVTAYSNPNGGFLGGTDGSGTQSACFWDTETSGKASDQGTATGKTTTQMQTQSTFADSGWNFTDVWQIVGTAYPTLRNPLLILALTDAATEVSTITASLNGRVNPDGDAVSIRFLLGTSSGAYTDSLTAVPGADSGDSLISVSALLTGLTPGLTYYYVLSIAGTQYKLGGEKTFSTLQSALTTQSPSDVTSISATLHATVDPGTDTVSVRFLIGTTSGSYSDSVIATPGTASGDSVSAVSAMLTGLKGGTTYYYVVAVESGYQYATGNEQSVVTSLASVTTLSAVGGALSGTVSGTVNPFTDTVSVRLLFGTSSGLYTDSIDAVPSTAMGGSPINVSASLSALSDITTYYVALAVSSQYEYVLGNELSFTTASTSWLYDLAFDAESTAYAKAQGVATTATDNFTIEAWVKWDGTTTGTHQLIASNGHAGADGYGAYLYSNGTIAILISAQAWLTTTVTPDSGAWNHIALVRDDGTWRLYKDGESLSLGGDTPTDPNTPSSNFFVGGDSASSYFFNGEVDDVRVSNIARYRSSFTPFHGPFPGDGNTAALYHFNDGTGTTAGDSSGNGNDLTLIGATWNGSNNSSVPADAETVPGYALDFSGDTLSSNYVEVPYTTRLNPSDNFTVELWARAEGGNGINHYRCPLGSETSYPDAQGYYFYAGSNDEWEVWVGQGVGGWLVMGSAVDVTLNAWTHLALTVSSGSVKFYVDGILVNSQTSIDFQPNTYGVPFRIGEVAETPGYWPFNGKVDEVRVWHAARTADQIRTTMYKTVSRSEADLVAYFQLHEGSGHLLQDQVTGLAGVLKGNTTWTSSTLPVANGSSTSTTGFTTGSAILGTVSLETTDSFDGAVDLVATALPAQPNELPEGSSTTLDDRYWVVDAFGTPGTFSVNLTFTVPTSFTNNGTASASSYTLYHRGSAADTSWGAIVSGASAVDSTSVTFSGVTSFSQFIIGTDDPLPVQMSALSAKREAHGVELRWSTVTEVDNAGWEVQRKIQPEGNSELRVSSGEWVGLGFVEGAGTSTSPQEYTFTDPTPFTIHHSQFTSLSYRLKQLDRSGASSYSQVVEVSLANLAPRVFHLSQNYPNPFNPSTTISYTLETDGLVTLKVYDLIGREVATLVSEPQKAGVLQQVVFDASRLSSGVYFTRLEAGNRSMLKKILLMK